MILSSLMAGGALCLASAHFGLDFFSVLTCFVASFLIISYFLTDLFFKPSWYRAHQSSKELVAVPPDVGDSWRVCEKNDGFGDPKTNLGLDFSVVEFPCGPFRLDGNTTLRGWHIPPKPSAVSEPSICIVICHGGGRDRRQHLRHVAHLRRRHNVGVLLFDKQEHGLSDGCGRGIGWFSYEGSDVYGACRYAKLSLKYSKVVAMGTSFGGVGVLTAAGHFDEGEQRFIDGVIAENPISSKYAFVREIAHSTGGFTYILPGFMRELLAWCICLVMTWRRGSYSIPDPIQVVDKISPRPLLITHGEADSLVPFEHGMILYEAATRGPKDFLGVPNCDHCMVQNVDPVGWYRTTSSVIESVLKESSTEESRKCL